MRILEIALPTRPVVPEAWMKPGHYQPGAIEILISLWVRGFREMGHECDVFCVGKTPLNSNPFFTLVNGGFNPRFGDWWEFNNTMIDLIQMSPIKYDIVHIHAYATAVSDRWNEIKVPVVYTWHDPATMTNKPKKEYQIESVVRNKKIKVVAISRTQRDARKLDIPYIHNGLDLDQFSFDRKRSDRYFTIGRIVPDKGFDIAVDSCHRTGKKLDLVGNLYHRKFFDHAIKPKLGNGIKFHGAVYGAEKKRFFETCRGLLNPIRWNEPFGLTLVEALASGAPVIGFDKGAVREVVGDCGVLVDSAPALRKTLENPPNISAHVCRKRAALFSYKKMCREYIKYFEEIS